MQRAGPCRLTTNLLQGPRLSAAQKTTRVVMRQKRPMHVLFVSATDRIDMSGRNTVKNCVDDLDDPNGRGMSAIEVGIPIYIKGLHQQFISKMKTD